MAFCTNCGSKLKEGVKFCTSCGAPVKRASAFHAISDAEQPSVPVPMEQTQEEPVPVEQTQEESVPVEQTQEEPVPVEQTQEEPVPVQQAQEEPVPVQQAQEEPVPTQEPEFAPLPVWRCNCGTENTGTFCIQCGAAKHRQQQAPEFQAIDGSMDAKIVPAAKKKSHGGRIVLIVIAVLLALALLVGCGIIIAGAFAGADAADDFAGIAWDLTALSDGGETYGIELFDMLGVEGSLSFSANGKCTLSFMGEETRGKYKAIDEKTLTLTIDGETAEAKLKKGILSLDLGDDTVLFFEEHGTYSDKNDHATDSAAEAPEEPAAPVAEAPEEPTASGTESAAEPAAPVVEAPADPAVATTPPPVFGGSAPYEGSLLGTWVCTAYVFGTDSFDAADMFETPCTLQFIDDGTASVNMMDYKETITWTQNGDSVLLSDSYVFGEEASIVDGKLHVEFTSMTLVFDPMTE